MPKHYRPAGKKNEGNAAKYVTRSQAVKQLQVTLPVFRKACILKGVYPREPKKKVKGNHQTYYHQKDIAFILHDPIVENLRNIRTHDKKIKKALSKKNKDKADRLKGQMPSYKLDRLIRERYLRFIDALGDLDDCLVTVHLFAALPALKNEKVSVERIRTCRRLSHEWQAFIARTHKLRKTFISVKGIYYQAELEGQKVTWLAPHSLQQVLTDDVDFNVLSTFLEFYEALLTFVNLRLYQTINVKYPPLLDPRLEALAAELYALSRYVASKSSSTPMNSADNQEVSDGPLALAQLQHQLSPTGALMHLVEETEVEDDEDEETKECRLLFKNMRVFLSREVPREPLLFVITAFGGMVSWEGEGSPLEECDQSISHQIVDRPTQGHKFLSREYVQPQWVFDCVNARIILPVEEYLVGKVPPPHLSPFVDNEAEGYVPDYAQKIKQLQAAARKEVLPVPAVGEDDVDDAQDLLLEGVANRVEAQEAVERKQKMLSLERQYHEELKMELQGVRDGSGTSKSSMVEKIVVPNELQTDENQTVDDDGDLDKMMLSRKKKNILKAIDIGKKRKQAGIDLIKSRKQKLQQSEEKSRRK